MRFGTRFVVWIKSPAQRKVYAIVPHFVDCKGLTEHEQIVGFEILLNLKAFLTIWL